MTLSDDDAAQLNIKEQLARIDRELATHAKLSLEVRTEPWKVATSAMAAGAALATAFTALGVLISKTGVLG